MTGTSIENSNDSNQRRARAEAEQADCGCDGQFEEVAGTNQSRWRRDAVRFPNVRLSR